MVQIFDVDRSLSVLGDRKQIQKIFGAPPISLIKDFEIQVKENNQLIKRSGMDQHLKQFLMKLFQKEKVTVRNELFGTEDEEIVIRMNEKARELGLSGIVIDSISGLGEAVRNDLVRTHRFDMMTRDLWGKYGVRMSNLLTTLRDLPVQLFLTCHIDRVESDDGVEIEYPAIKGSQKTDSLRWFDVIVYNSVVDGKNYWQVSQSDSRPFIRTRYPIPEWEGETYVEPNYLPVLRAYWKSSTPLKMLVCGDSGTGKTYALRTFADYVKSKQDKDKSSKNSKSDATEGSGKSSPDPDGSSGG